MRNYIVLLLALMLTIGSLSAIANVAKPSQTQNAMKVVTIESMYQQDVDNQGQDYPVVLERYADQELQAAMQLEREYFDREQMSCHIGYDVLWDSQDPDYVQDKQFALTEQGLVKVSLAQGSDIYYQLACTSIDAESESECRVADVVLDEELYEGETLKSFLIKKCS